jgi:glutamate decarboxylase
VVWRSPEYLPKELVFNINYLGADQASFTLNFSKGASQVIGQYYQFIRLGKPGYRAIMTNLTKTADHLSRSLERMGFIIMSQTSGKGLPLVAFRFANAGEKGGKKDRHYDEFDLARTLRSRGWVVPAYTMAPHTEKLKMVRVVVREDFSKSRSDMLLHDIELVLGLLEKTNSETLKQQTSFAKSHTSAASRHNRHHQNTGKAHHGQVYKDEEHSLQGKTGKTHAVC